MENRLQFNQKNSNIINMQKIDKLIDIAISYGGIKNPF